VEIVTKAVHTTIALIISITTTIAALAVFFKEINEFLKGYRELIDFIKKGGKLKMTKSVKIFFIVISCFLIGLGIFGVRGFTEPIPTLRAPFDMTLYYYPSGWMGDGEKGTRHVQLNTGFRECNRSGNTDGICTQIRYRPDPNGKGWAGIYWQYPDSNWGDKPGRKIVKATKITFWAKGETGDEIVEFKAGGINASKKTYRDSFEVARRIRLNRDWTNYEISLTGQDLSHVIGAFAWVASRNANPDGLTFYIDDIRYE
jgi:hypothetical protein